MGRSVEAFPTLTAIMLVLLLTASSLEAGTYGPGPLFRKWGIGSIAETCGFSMEMMIVSLNGSGLIEAALASGPQRIGVAIVYGGGAEAYLMAGDQNSWHRLGGVGVGETMVIDASYDRNGSVLISVALGETRVVRGFNYTGAPPNEFRLVLSPITGRGAVIKVVRLVLRRDWISYTIVPLATARPTHSTSAAAPSTSMATNTTTRSARPPPSSIPANTAKPVSIVLSSGEREKPSLILLAGILALIIGVAAVLLHRYTLGQGP